MPLTIARRRTGAGGNLDHKANTTQRLDYLAISTPYPTSSVYECQSKVATPRLIPSNFHTALRRRAIFVAG